MGKKKTNVIAEKPCSTFYSDFQINLDKHCLLVWVYSIFVQHSEITASTFLS